ncbi:App1 family protein [Sphingobium tyrosinilyticum]|uniref:App1 family protein n=1 Tax=Sphingobium tyrosinilyticum TaxID=2715436 RepID=A0ABV9EXY6_9SPHN
MTEQRSFFSTFLRAAAVDVEADIDRIEDLLFRDEDPARKIRLLTYAGYRNDREVRFSGRVIRFRDPLDAGEGTLSRLRAMMAIYNSEEVPEICVRCDAYGGTAETWTDEEGYFSFALPLKKPLPETTRWEEAVVSTPEREAQQVKMAVPIMAPALDSHWGVISDIDDTVVETGATNFVKNWRRVLVDRPQDRLAVPGAARLYQMIAHDHQAPARPFFYVSSSPWNLYGFIAEFMEQNGIPHGPMFLTDYGIDPGKLIKAAHDTHKLAAIEAILAFYPQLRFLLIGDNGQHDVEIYARVVRDFPGRVAAVFIRDVEGSCKQGAKGALLNEMEASGIPIFCGAGFNDALAAAERLELDRPFEAAKAISAKAS